MSAIKRNTGEEDDKKGVHDNDRDRRKRIKWKKRKKRPRKNERKRETERRKREKRGKHNKAYRATGRLLDPMRNVTKTRTRQTWRWR